MNTRIRLGLAATAFCVLFPLLTTSGCSRDKASVERKAMAFVEAIEKQDSESFDRIMDWERYYSYGKSGGEKGAEGEPPLDIEAQKELLLNILARDRGLALKYLTSENSIEKVSVEGAEAQAVILQVDRANGAERRVTLLLHRDENREWKIYRFSTEESE